MFRNEALERGRFKRAPDRWQTEFGRWVADFGVPRIVAGLADDPDLRVTNQAVYEWLQGHAPSPARAMALGIPAKIRPDCVTPEMISLGMQSYVDRATRYRRELRRLD